MNLRASAANIISALLQQHGSLSSALEQTQLPERDRAWLQALCFEVMRYCPTLQALTDPLLDKPLKARDQDIYALLLIGICQLRYMRVAEHAAINETVQACIDLRKGWAKGLINAVLRQYQRRQSELEQALSPAAAAAHPPWLWQAIQRDWPDHAERIIACNNSHPPMTLRVNRQHETRDIYQDRLDHAGITATPCAHAPDGLRLHTPVPVDALPGFHQGEASVQDESAQLAALLLPATAGLRVLDACAAPGGKTGHWLEIEPQLIMTALDIDTNRLRRVEENLQRLDFVDVTLCSGDLGYPAEWWDGTPFDAILLDAPCSGTGVIRRHPDIKLLRKASAIRELVEEQRVLLAAAWSMLAPNGILLYSTCSILPEENTAQIDAFLNATPDAREEPIDAGWGVACSHGRQILPDVDGGDGFYYARLRKHSSTP
ncbi:MAG TPA: 16S rRNA (cytosine(967)-C(5))-methyltransferase RsmB [Pseudomonadales bacterium]